MNRRAILREARLLCLRKLPRSFATERACHLQADQFGGPLMVDNPVWEICERVAEVQALLDDHINGGTHSAADVVAKAVLSSDLLRAASAALPALVYIDHS